MSGRSRLVAVLLVTAVALAFADASVVALALPDLYAEFDTTIVGVSWVLDDLRPRRRRGRRPGDAAPPPAAAARARAGRHRRLRRRLDRRRGAGDLPVLLVARAVQGLGATLLLAGSLPVLAAVMASEDRARRWWALAATVGAVRRSGPRRRAHPAPRLAGDLLRPGADRGRRRCWSASSRRPGRCATKGTCTASPASAAARQVLRQRRVRARVRGPRRRAVPRRAAGHRGVALQPDPGRPAGHGAARRASSSPVA